MQRLRKSIPSLGALNLFEAAARRESFTKAAAELGVTQAAVSRRVKELEALLGTALFVRANRRVHLSPAGQDLFDAVSMSFDQIAKAVDTIKSATATDIVTIGVSLAFAHFRLLPALTAFHELYPDIRIRVVSDDGWSENADQSLDLELRYSAGNLADLKAIASLPELVFPVCAPHFAKKHGINPAADISAQHLATLPLIEGEQRAGQFLSWAQWFKGLGVETPTAHPRLQYSNYSDAAYAAMNGDGVAVGWGSLLQRPLSDGRLVPLGQVKVTPPGQHKLLVKNDDADKTSVRVFADWLTTTMAQADPFISRQ
jgi:LysR family glycine cleavage system transcriptional activator